jgi:hypothetical protein
MIEIILIQAIAGTVIVASVGIAAALAWRVHHRREIGRRSPRRQV